MGTISLKVNDEKNYNMVLAMLKALEENDIVSLSVNSDENLALPGEPFSPEKLIESIKKAEESPDVSAEDAKTFFKILTGS